MTDISLDHEWLADLEHAINTEKDRLRQYTIDVVSLRKLITAAYRSLDAEAQEWRPIETAPKDGKSFLGRNPALVAETWAGDPLLHPGKWFSRWGVWAPSEWMSLPAPSPEPAKPSLDDEVAELVNKLRSTDIVEGGFDETLDHDGQPRGYQLRQTELGKEAAALIERLVRENERLQDCNVELETRRNDAERRAALHQSESDNG